MITPETNFMMEEPPPTGGISSTDASIHCPSSYDGDSVSVSFQQEKLQKDLNRISSLCDLFVKQSQTLALMGSEEQSYTFLNNSLSFDCPSSSTNTWVDTAAGNEGRSGDLAIGRSFEENLHSVSTLLKRSSFAKSRQEESSPTSVAQLMSIRGLSSSFDRVERILNFDDESEDIDSTDLASMDESTSDIQAAINELRKEASQIDIIMALDSLKTVQAELLVASRALQERATQVEDLTFQLMQKEERIGSLELERDLYKADASKLRDDLKTCVDRMFDISAVAGNSTLPDSETEARCNKEQKWTRDVGSLRSVFSLSDSIITPMKRSSCLDSASVSENRDDGSELYQPEKVGRVQASRGVCLQKIVGTEAFPLIGSFSKMIFRPDRQSTHLPSPEKTHSTHSLSTESPPTFDPREQEDILFDVTSCSPPALNDDDHSTDSKRRCFLFRKRSSKRSHTSAKEVAAMRQQIDHLHVMMTASLETSEKLRQRLALISRYYEGIIATLQQQMVEAKTENSRRKAEMDSKTAILDHDKRVAVLSLETQLQQRDREIAVLKEKIQGLKYEI